MRRAWVRYATACAVASVSPAVASGELRVTGLDVKQYHVKYQEFPFCCGSVLREAQWESYRNLGEHVASTLVEHGPWLWNIPL
jgi:hypothetical protein